MAETIILEKDGKGIRLIVTETEVVLRLDEECSLTGPLEIIVPNQPGNDKS